MTKDVLGSAFMEIAGSSAANLGVSMFEVSSVWKSIERHNRMLEQMSGLEALVQSAVGVSALGAPAEKISRMVSQPLVERAAASFERIGQDVGQAAFAGLKLPDLNSLLDTQRLMSHAMGNLALVEKVNLTMFTRHGGPVEDLLRALLGLDDDSEGNREHWDLDTGLVSPAGEPFLGIEDRVLLVRAFWVFFVLAQLATPEGRQLLDEYSVIWGLITAVVFSYRPTG